MQDIIIGNIAGASGVHPNLVNTKATVSPYKVDNTQSLHTGIPKAIPEPITKSEICLSTNTSAIDADTTTDMNAAVQTRAMVVKESKPPKPVVNKRQFTLTMGGLHATFTPHETKLTSTDLKPSLRQLLRRLWRRL